MKTVYFIRHAKSSWKFPELKDHDRPLNDRGHHDAPKMAALLKSQARPLDLIITSTANRAKTTAEYFKEAYEISDSNFWVEKELYHAPPETLVGILNRVPEEYEAVAVFAHNPGMTMLADKLNPDPVDNVPTCGITVADCDVDWDQCEMHHLTFNRLLTPKNSL